MLVLITSIDRQTVSVADDSNPHYYNNSTRSPAVLAPDHHHHQRSDSLMESRKSIDVNEVPHDEDDSSDDDEVYHSFESDLPTSESEERELTEEEKRSEHKARALERQRVMEAAGLIIKAAQGNAPPRPLRRRRTPPQTPQRQSICSIGSYKDLPPIPEPDTPLAIEPEPVLHVDDAFERYENFKKSQNYRLSVASFDSYPPPSPGAASIASPGLQSSPSDGPEARTRTNSFFGFLGRSRTPGSDTDTRPRLQISAPIPLAVSPINGNSEAPTPRESSPAFGSVRIPFFFPRVLNLYSLR